MLASIAVPAHDVRPSYFAAAVDSCLRQSGRSGLELVVVVVGARSIVLDDVVVQEGTTIGSDCVDCGFVCDGAILGEECIVMGSLVHGVRDPDLPWGQYEPNPILEERKRWGY